MLIAKIVVWGTNSLVAPVATIGNNFFTHTQVVLEPAPKNLQIWPASTFKRTIIGNNLACMDTHSNLIPQPWTIKFV
jgi:hypothetical protein